MPAYWPSFLGVQVVVKRDERADKKKVITMDMLSEEDMEDMSGEAVDVDEGIDMAIVIADVVAGMVIPDMSILEAAVVYEFDWPWD